MQVNVLEAKNRLSELIRNVLAGEEVIIANRGHAVVRLVPMEVKEATDRFPVGSAAAILRTLDRPRPGWVPRSHEEIEADIQEARNAWD